MELALNGVHFVDVELTDRTFKYYVQPANFSTIHRAAALASGTMVTLRGEGSSRSRQTSKVRCRWSADTNLTLPAGVAPLDAHDTVALSLTDDTVVCRAHAKSTPSLRELKLSLNSVDFGATGLTQVLCAALGPRN